MNSVDEPRNLVANRHGHAFLPPNAWAALIAALFTVGLIALLSYRSLQSRIAIGDQITHTFAVSAQLEGVLSSIKDAETGQRGFLLIGKDSYLEPYAAAKAAVPGEIKALQTLVGDDMAQRKRLDALDQLTKDKLQELNQTIELYNGGDHEAALAVVRTDRGKLAMDQIRALVQEMSNAERNVLAERQKEFKDAADFSSNIVWGGSTLLVFLIITTAIVTSRNFRTDETNRWLRSGQMELSARILGDQSVERLGEKALGFLAEFLDVQAGAIYIRQGDGNFRRVAAYASEPASERDLLRPGDGLLGQAAKDNQPLRVRDVPKDYLAVVSSIGRGTPRELLIAPASIDGIVQAVVELGFFRSVHAADQEFLARVSELLGVAVRSSKDRSRLEELLEETQRQAEELQTQQEELRVNNEELEEQGRMLKESQSQLEAQQTELEQTNSHLEEQAQLLEHQKESLTSSQGAITEKAAALERANQYKSEFLANMSHELRTPLNSTLILAKLLADNKQGNLTDEQVKFAQTISSAGNDLLVLINDVLDLSKIEAGKVEVEAQAVRIAATIETMAKTFQPMAQEKGLAFHAVVEESAPQQIETDVQRLGQILKNLLSNALKFTQRGEISLRVISADERNVSFVVRDSGIGISADQQEIIFEAFRQADGSTHRKYGGTGLGLSISRDLARMLGGDIKLHSTPGEGSTFVLTLPLVYSGSAVASGVSADIEGSASATPAPAQTPARAPATESAPAASVTVHRALDDDRDTLSPDSRLILVIEDDLRFAAILRDLIREMNFQCVLTHSAGDGLAAATLYRPSAILLDMNLPDHSGLGVLDQLKRNGKTRHIPVHVVSVADYSHEARELGAIGYALKPVKREHLIDALRRLEEKFSQSLHRVLVVEDDERQRDSIRQLLGNAEVQITTVATATEALAQLGKVTFDCMVMDLNLPDMSGYELLEKMASQDSVAFPPVIVYTGRSLTRDEEQSLRRLSKSIIVKDAHSPERLLDEVTLFLHQVESKLPAESQRMLKAARDRDSVLENRRILVVEDDVRNIFALSSVLEPKGAKVEIARNGREALDALARSSSPGASPVDLVLMDIMMPEMDGLTAMREIRKRTEWKRLPIIALTAKAMKDDQEKCLAAGANDYIAKPLDVEKLLSLVRVWMPKK